MHTLTRIAPVLALLATTALVACDKNDGPTDTEDSASTGASESGESGEATESGESTGSSSDTGSDTDASDLPCDAAHYEASRECNGGTQFCAYNTGDSSYAWGACVAEPACTNFGDVDCRVCLLDESGVPYVMDECGGEGSTPLVLNFDGAAIEYGSGGRRFDLVGCEATDWPTARTPWLALDHDRSGAIDGGHELFGSSSRLRGGALADNGFAALAELDQDGDRRITAADPAFADLVLWADGDGDRRSSGLELQSLATLGLEAIELVYASERRCDARANCEVERASFTWRDGLGRAQVGEVVDVHLACQ
jgi:hypothetical protein